MSDEDGNIISRIEVSVNDRRIFKETLYKNLIFGTIFPTT